MKGSFKYPQGVPSPPLWLLVWCYESFNLTSRPCLDQILLTSMVDIICEEDEGNGDDELTTELVSDEDEILRVGLPLSSIKQDERVAKL